MRRRSRAIILFVAWMFYLVIAAFALLETTAIVILTGAYCDNCTPDDIAKIAHPFDVTVTVVVVTFIAGVAGSVWWMRRPA